MGQAVLVDIIEECCAQHIVQVIRNIGAVRADGLGQVHDSQFGVEVEMLFLENPMQVDGELMWLLSVFLGHLNVLVRTGRQ